jgi:hypothetical protein
MDHVFVFLHSIVQAQSDTLEACEDFKMDYFECIHHKKEVSMGTLLMHALC